MKNLKSSVVSIPFVFVMGIIIGVGNVDNIVYADPQKTQELQMHLDKVMNELNNNNTEGAKMHLQGAQMMIASIDEGDNNTENATASNHTTGVSNNTES